VSEKERERQRAESESGRERKTEERERERELNNDLLSVALKSIFHKGEPGKHFFVSSIETKSKGN
jgi:hypothetical protein